MQKSHISDKHQEIAIEFEIYRKTCLKSKSWQCSKSVIKGQKYHHTILENLERTAKLICGMEKEPLSSFRGTVIVV
jgi:hypothetical protein